MCAFFEVTYPVVLSITSHDSRGHCRRHTEKREGISLKGERIISQKKAGEADASDTRYCFPSFLRYITSRIPTEA